jgi:glutathione S-transferase
MNILRVLPALPVFRDYVARATDRPAYRRYVEKEQELAKKVTPPPFAGRG